MRYRQYGLHLLGVNNVYKAVSRWRDLRTHAPSLLLNAPASTHHTSITNHTLLMLIICAPTTPRHQGFELYSEGGLQTLVLLGVIKQ